MFKKNPFKIISIGGSLIIPKDGFNPSFLKKFKSLIEGEVKKGGRFVLVSGGGQTARSYQGALKETVQKTSAQTLDRIGIDATILNAKLLIAMFGELVNPTVITKAGDFGVGKKPIFVAGGFRPGQSTDAVAVELAIRAKAKEIINLSNIDYVYSADPNLDPKAEKILTMGWEDFRRNISGKHWRPGANSPFDPVASARAEKSKLVVKILNGHNLKEVKNALSGRKFVGTVIGD